MIHAMMDSGAFSAWTQNLEINIDDYCEFIKKYGELLDQYISLDVIGDGDASYKNWVYMREKGLRPLPVFHAGSDLKYLRIYVEQVDYICLGAVASLDEEARIRNLDMLWKDFLIDKDGMPKVKVHALGVTSVPLMLRYPWYSVDSTTWLKVGMYGNVFIPKVVNGEYVYNQRPLVVSVSTNSPGVVYGDTKHISSLSSLEKSIVFRYFEEKGIKMGKSEYIDIGPDYRSYPLQPGELWCNEGLASALAYERGIIGDDVDLYCGNKCRMIERVIEPGLCNNRQLRIELNALFFKGVMEVVPEWPWPFRVEEGIRNFGF